KATATAKARRRRFAFPPFAKYAKDGAPRQPAISPNPRQPKLPLTSASCGERARVTTKAIDQSLRPSGFAPAFGRAEAASRSVFMARLKAVPLSKTDRAFRAMVHSWG